MLSPRGHAGRLPGRLRRLALPRPRRLWPRSGRLLAWTALSARTAWLRGRVARRRGSTGRWSALRPAPPEPPLGARNAGASRRVLARHRSRCNSALDSAIADLFVCYVGGYLLVSGGQRNGEQPPISRTSDMAPPRLRRPRPDERPGASAVSGGQRRRVWQSDAG